MNIIVNASGAKIGGARTIVESYAKWIENNDSSNQYFFIVGFDLVVKANNIKVVNLKTKGLESVFFAVIGILYYCIIFRANTVFSFMNVNTVFPFIKRVTYFHQAKFFSEKSFRFLTYRLFLSLQKKSTFICQNSEIKRQLKAFYRHSKITKIIDLWPGIFVPDTLSKPKWYDDAIKSSTKIALCPYADIRMKHKAFNVIYNSYDFFKERNIKVIITSSCFNYQNNDVFYFSGNCDYSELHFLYNNVDMILFPSFFETVGLPIFEAQYYGLPVILSDVPYVKTLIKKFPDLNLFINDSNIIYFNINQINRKKIPSTHACFTGEWAQIQNFF